MAFSARRLRVQLPCGETTVGEPGQVVPTTYRPVVDPLCNNISCGVYLVPSYIVPEPTVGCVPTEEGQSRITPDQVSILRRSLELRLEMVDVAARAVAALDEGGR